MGTKRVKRKAGLRWVGAAATPWVAGIGLLVSFTATAGTESSIGSSLAIEHDARMVPALPPGALLIGAGEVRDEGGTLLAEALNPEARRRRVVAEEPPRADLKSQARSFPVVQRSAKGDALVAPGQSFERSARRLREGGPSLVFANLTGSVTGVLTPGPAAWNPDLEPESGFQPVPDLGLGLSPGASAGAEAGAELAAEGPHDGSTPAVPRAVALSSTTPAPADAIPVEVAASSLAVPGFSFHAPAQPGTASTLDATRNRYADLIEPESMDREQRCLAEAVYFEARSEPEEGQAAVAQVVLNRVKSGLYPASVCGVVYQNRHRYMGCQFSFACEGKSLRITDAPSWQSATRIAKAVIEGRTYLSEVGAATHYHADYVKPRWSRRLTKMDVIGRHIFYRLKPGQT